MCCAGPTHPRKAGSIARAHGNRLSGDPSEQLRKRHDASDFGTKAQDKLAAES
jgi:hypothetical protein